MRDYKHTAAKTVSHNRVKKVKKERKPINFRPFLTWGARIIGGMSVAGVVGAVSWYGWKLVSQTVFFRLEKVDVANTRRVSREELMALAGVKTGDDLLKFNLKQMGEHIGKNPWIQQVSVRRYFPHTLSIQVKEREPVAIVNMGCLYYVDRKGDVFKPLSPGDSLDYPVITGFAEEELVKDPAGNREALQKGIALIDTLKTARAFRLEDVSELHFDKGFGFTIFTANGGVPVKLGADGYAEKLERLAKIYRDIQPQMLSLEYIDLNYFDKIIVKKALG